MEKKLKRSELIESIKNSIPENLSELEIAAFIEKAVADNIVFDETYLWGNKETKRRIYELAKHDAKKSMNDVKRCLLCTTISELYASIGKEFGLDIEYQRTNWNNLNEIAGQEIFDKISAQSLDHVNSILKLKDGRRIKIDIQKDLANLKLGCAPLSFGEVEIDDIMLAEVSMQEVIKIFRHIYGFENDEYFTDDYIEVINFLIENEPIEKIEQLFTDERIQQILKRCGPVEAKVLSKMILRSVLSEPTVSDEIHDSTYIYELDNTCAHIRNCFLISNDNKKRYSFFVYIEDKTNTLFFVFSRNARKMIKVSPEELYKMKQKGMEIKPIIRTEEDRRFVDEIFKRYEERASDKSCLEVNVHQLLEDDELEQ